MVIKRQIQVLVSVGIIFTMMLHMVIPHAHHHHRDKEEIAHSHSKHEHAHDDGHGNAHSKDHDDKEDNNRVSFFFPAAMHLHAFHIHDFVNASKKRNLQLSIKRLPFPAIINSMNSCLETRIEQSYNFAFFRQIFYDNPFIEHCSLRAPPEPV